MNASKINLDGKKQEPESVTLWIDSYSDIFSDFDPRPFSNRMVSDDFINQIKRVSRETREKVVILKLLVPEGTQRDDEEKVIRIRLETYFSQKYEQKLDELRKVRSRALSFIISDVILMLIASYIVFAKLTGFHINILLVLFEPGGWFLFWTGLEGMVSASSLRKTELTFYTKLSSVHIEFGSYK